MFSLRRPEWACVRAGGGAAGPVAPGWARPGCSNVQDAFEVVEVLAERRQRRGGPVAVGGTVAGVLHRGEGHVGQLAGDGAGVVAAGLEPAGDPVAHADYGQRCDPGVGGPELASAYPVLDDAGDGFQYGPAAGVVGGGQFRGQVGLRADEQPEPFGLGGYTGDGQPGDLAELADGIQIRTRGQLGDLRGGAAGDVRGQLGQQLVLALDVVVQRGTGDAERVGDVLQAGPGEAAVGEQPDRVLIDLLLDEPVAGRGGAGRLAAIAVRRGRHRAALAAGRAAR